MNKAILVGWITDIREVGSYGVMVKLKTCEKGFTTQKGYKIADRIDYHVCLAKGTITRYILDNFNVGNLVELTGKIYNKLEETKHGDKVQLTNIHIQTINLYSLNNISPVSKSNGNTKSVENPDLYFE